MKNVLRNALAVVALSTTFAACSGDGKSGNDTTHIDSSTITTITDTLKPDTNSMVPDTLKKDTTITTTKTQTKTKIIEVKH
ncbi:hypothetical protein [Mucilaginibacter antarcticus]|uniref:Uncharacterized protein n=1 Tax=Mucilaginibacter antarcticus TaxID=1855725 RepID=A0ABW5XV36_9SPHI